MNRNFSQTITIGELINPALWNGGGTMIGTGKRSDDCGYCVSIPTGRGRGDGRFLVVVAENQENSHCGRDSFADVRLDIQ